MISNSNCHHPPPYNLNHIGIMLPLLLLLPLVGAWPQPQINGYKAAADQLYRYMDTTVDPCQDFYSFACGGFARQHKLQPDDIALSPMILAQRQVLNTVAHTLKAQADSPSRALVQGVNYWQSLCTGAPLQLDYALLYNITQLYGGWPILNQTRQHWPSSSRVLGQLLGSLVRSSAFGLSVEPNDLEPTQPLLILMPPIQHYPDYGDYNQTSQMIQQIVQRFVQAVPDGSLAPNASLTQAYAFNISVVAMEVYQEAQQALSTYDPTKPPPIHLYNVSSAQARWKAIDWQQMLLQGLAAKNLNAAAFNANTNFSIPYPAYFDYWNATMGAPAMDAVTMQNYLLWTLVRDQVYRFDVFPPPEQQGTQEAEKEAARRNRQYSQRHNPTMKRQSPPNATDDLQCANSLMAYLPYVAGRLLVDAMESLADKQDIVQEMVQGLQLAFVNRTQQQPWLTAHDKADAVNKTRQMAISVTNLGYPDWLLNNTALDARYAPLNLLPTDKPYVAALKLQNFTTWSYLQLLNEPKVDRTDFIQSPAVVNAWYVDKYNSLTFPVGLWHPTLLDVTYPLAVNYGHLATLAGHELSHGFDFNGIYWTETGAYDKSSWLSPQAHKQFNATAVCLAKQYSRFCEPSSGECVNGNNTLSENMADNGGMALAYALFMRSNGSSEGVLPYPMNNYNMQQAFFISYAQFWCSVESADYAQWQIQYDVHSPNKFRVLGVLNNTLPFFETFNCKAPTPRSTCQVW